MLSMPEGWNRPVPDVPTHGGNKHVEPVKWALTIQQFFGFVEACMSTLRWKDLQNKEIHLDDGTLVKAKGYVNGYQFCDHFVKPYTQGTGCSLALLENSNPVDAEIMLSHSWSEDIEELRGALREFDVCSRIWFCICANYQPEDGAGPSITEQLAQSPFKNVIEHVQEMFVVHTSTAEVYDRLWCVHEIDEALYQGKTVRPCFSYKYILSMMCSLQSGNDCWWTVDTQKASVTREDDRKMICQAVEQKGGFARLDQVISQWRNGMVQRIRDLIEGSILSDLSNSELVDVIFQSHALVEVAAIQRLRVASDLVHYVAADPETSGGINERHAMMMSLKLPPQVTTLHVRNLPTHITQNCFLHELESSGFSGFYDFCYRPRGFGDFDDHCDFAIVNFISAAAARNFVVYWHFQSRFGMQSQDNRVNISPATLQGLEANRQQWDTDAELEPNLRPFIRHSGAGALTQNFILSRSRTIDCYTPATLHGFGRCRPMGNTFIDFRL